MLSKPLKLKLYHTDDDPEDREFLREAINFNTPTADITGFGNGLLLFQHFSSNSTGLPDIIILDLNMPIMDGYETLKRLKETEHLRQIPVIIFTTSAIAQNERQCKLLGCAHFITKPNSINGFGAIVALIASYAVL